MDSTAIDVASEILAENEGAQKMKMAKRTRQKVRYEYIVKDSSRRVTFRKRKNSLLKKVNELSILCDISACLVIFWAEQPQPIVWPSPEVAKELLQRFLDLPDMEKYSERVDQEAYLRKRVRKMEIKLKKQQKKNKEALALQLMHQIYNEGRELSDLDTNEREALLSLVTEKVKHNLTTGPSRRHPVFSTDPLAGPGGTSAVAANGQKQAFSADGTNHSESRTWMDWNIPSFAQKVVGDCSSSSSKFGENESSASYMALLLGDDDGDDSDDGHKRSQSHETSGKAIEGGHEKEMASTNRETGGIGESAEKVLADENSGGGTIRGVDGSSVLENYDMVIGEKLAPNEGQMSIWNMSDENFLKLVGFGENVGDEGGNKNDGGQIGNLSESDGHGRSGSVSAPSGNMAEGSSKGNENDDDIAGLFKRGLSDYVNMSWPLIE